MEAITARLFALQDLPYRDFQAKLIPTVDKDLVIGVRTPDLRNLAKQLQGTAPAEAFLRELPHRYFEENNLHGFLLEYIRDYDACMEALNSFLPYIDNWATCDQLSPGVLGKHLQELLSQIKIWMASGHTYTLRFGMGMLMRYFLDEAFAPEYLSWVAEISSEEYYVNMMAAWFFATAMAKQHDAALPYLQEKRLPKWVHNKAIQKAVESRRITPEQKIYLKTLKIK